MISQAVTPNKDDLFQRDSLLVKDDEFRLSGHSIYANDNTIIDNNRNQLIFSFLLFAVMEYMLLYILQRYFLIHKFFFLQDENYRRLVLNDFEISKYFFYKFLGIFIIVFNKKNGMDHISLILKEFWLNQSFCIYLVMDVLLIFLTLSLLQKYPISVILLIIHPKIIFQLITKILKRYPLKFNEMLLLFAFLVFVVLIIEFSDQIIYLAIFPIIMSGGLFFAREELINVHINLQEWDVLKYLSTFFVFVLFFAKNLLTNGFQSFNFEYFDLIMLLLILGMDYVRTFTIKKIHSMSRENSSKVYFPIMIVFVGAFGVLFDITSYNYFMTWGNIIGVVIFLITLAYFYQLELMRLFKSPTEVVNLDSSEDLLIQR